MWPRRREGADNRPIFEYRWTIEGLRPYPYLRQKVLILKNSWALPSYRTKDKMYAVIYIIGVAIEEIRVTVTALISRLEVRTKFIKLIRSIVHSTPCLWLGQTRTKLYNLSRLEVRTKFIKLIRSIVHSTPCLWLGQTRTKLYNLSRLEVRTKFIKLIRSIVHSTPCLWLGQTRTKLYNLFRKDSSYSPLPSPSQCFFFFFFFSLLPGFFIVIINDFLTTVATK